MTEQVPLETIFEQIDRVRGQLLEEADQTVARVTALVAPLVTAIPTRVAMATEEVAVITEADIAPLGTFYAREMRPFAEKPDARGYALADPARARAMFEGLRTLVPPAVHESVKDLRGYLRGRARITAAGAAPSLAARLAAVSHTGVVRAAAAGRDARRDGAAVLKRR